METIKGKFVAVWDNPWDHHWCLRLEEWGRVVDHEVTPRLVRFLRDLDIHTEVECTMNDEHVIQHVKVEV